MKKIRIAIADDHSVVRMGLAALLKYERDMTVVGKASDGQEAVRLAQTEQPDVVIMDLMMPVLDGVAATARIRKECPNVRVLVLTTFGSSADVSRALAAGASGALMKDASNDELLEAIRTVAAGDEAVSPDIRSALPLPSDEPLLTRRQQEVLEYATRGLTNADIARIFGISTDAVKQHLSAVFAKLGAANRAEAIAIVLRRQLLKA